MKVLILGTTDPLRHEIAQQALKASHQVTTFDGDLLEIGAIDPSMAAQEAVIFPLANYEATDNIVRAMRRHNARRLICLCAQRSASLYERMVHPAALHAAHQDTTRQEDVVRKCDRNWLLVRHPRFTPGPPRGRYVVLPRSSPVRDASLPVADIAEFAVSQLQNDKYLYKTVALSNLTFDS